MSYFTFVLFAVFLMVHAEDCPTKNQVEKPESPLCCDAMAEVTCQKNAVWSSCVSLCPATCTNPTGIHCPPFFSGCIANCACENGFVLNDEGECVTVDKCPQL
ncbi:chymotrypsin inhibitor isoform X1 [Megalopta genalis]|uniref:chymotrypsin inhibitor isoform X1 n=1 Tax=Megalopta genalis TaxID=115081 RepID=UPI003FD528A9